MRALNLIPRIILRLLLAAIGGFLSSLAMPTENLWPLIFVSVLLILTSVRNLNLPSSFLVGFTGGLVFYLSQIEWMTLYLGPVPWIALSTLEALIFGIGASAISLVWRRLDSLKSEWFTPTLIALAIATIWTAREWVAINFPYGGFPWSRVAQALSDSPFATLVFFVGISGLSFVTVFISVVIIQIFESRQNFLRQRSLGAILTVFLVALSSLFTVPIDAEEGTVTLAAVQGNANAGLFANPERGTFLKNHLEATEALREHPRRNEVEFIVWPENASDLNPQQDALAKLQIDSLVKTFDVPIALGAITEGGEEIFNSSLLYGSDGTLLDQYDKKRPVPFAEYVPDRDFWYSLAPDLIGLVSRGYAFGTRDGIFELDEKKYGVLICFEIAIDDIGRDLVFDGAQIILSQTNNADFGRSDETFQQAALARLRAIETGRALVNISTVGLSVIYLPDGSVVEELPIYTPGLMVQTLPLRSSITPAMAIGSYFDLLINILAIGLVIGSLGNLIRRKESVAP
jgi:apolipoprotein N-acyltransferase